MHFSIVYIDLGMLTFYYFFEKRSFPHENDDEKSKNETIVYLKVRFLKIVVFKTIVFQNNRRFVNNR